MNKPDNHIDELGAILEQWLDNAMSTSSMGWSAIDGYKGQEENSEKVAEYDYDNYLKSAIRQIEDFYRNKILEVTKKPTILPKTNNAEAVKQGINFYHKTMQKRITAQFNRKVDDE